MRGDRLKQVRTQRGYTQESLAEVLGIGQKQIWRYENEETKPDGDTIGRIAQVLNVSADYLLGISEEARPLFTENDLSPDEIAVISSWRMGKKLHAIRVIAGDE